MRGCQGLHCGGCRHGGGTAAGTGALVLVIGILLIAAHRRAIGHAAHAAVDVLAVALITLAVAALTAAGGWLIRRRVTRRRVRRAALPLLRVRVIQPGATPAVEARPDGSLRALPSAERIVQVRPGGSLRVLPGGLPGGQRSDRAARKERHR